MPLTPAWLNDPKLVDPDLTSFALVFAGQYEAALDWIEHQSHSTIPELAFSYLNSALFYQKVDQMPRYRELVARLTTVGTETK